MIRFGELTNLNRDAEEYLEENGSAIKAVTPTHF